MSSLAEIESQLRGAGDLRERIARRLGSSGTALLALSPNEVKAVGSGSFVFLENAHYILTAAHVWNELQAAPEVGITVTDNIDHRFGIPTSAINPTTLQPENLDWNEWGPDLALLRIPAEQVGGIKAFQVFEHITAPPKHLKVDCLEAWVAMGAPGALGKLSPTHAELQILGLLVEPKSVEHGQYDYFDFKMTSSAPDIPTTWGGMSGGGLWRVLVYHSPETGKIDWAQRLWGVIYWQFPLDNGYRTVRSHGRQSILTIANLILPSHLPSETK
jgi:hypothetical protein